MLLCLCFYFVSFFGDVGGVEGAEMWALSWARLAPAGPSALWAQHLYPCSLIIFTIIYCLLLSAAADSFKELQR